MDSFVATKRELIHYWTDQGTESIDFTLAKARLFSHFSEFNIVFSASELKKGNTIAQSIFLKQFKDHFPAGTIHICDLSFLSSQPKRFIILEYQNQFFLGPDNGFFPLGFSEMDVDYFRINNEPFFKDPLGEIYIPTLHTILSNKEKKLSELFEVKTVMVKSIWIKPIINDMNMRLTCLYIDHQGSAFFNITKTEFEEARKGRKVVFRLSGNNILGLKNQADDVPEGEIVAYFDWGNLLKLVQNSGNFSKHLAVYENTQILVEFKDPK
jgi:S-adenosylmethionine hydrolase